MHSYQSAASGWKEFDGRRRRSGLRLIGLLTLSMVLAAARPYEDTRKRFRVTLPSDWKLSPQFGDTKGMVFERSFRSNRGRGIGIFMVRVDAVEAASVDAYADLVERELGPGLTTLSRRRTKMAGGAAEVRDYRQVISESPRVEKKIRAHYLAARGRIYQLHFETESRHFRTLERDLTRILSTFEPLAGTDAEPVEAESPTIVPPDVFGRWRSEQGIELVLGRDRGFRLADLRGEYEINGGRLVLVPTGKDPQHFSYALDAAGTRLTLTSPQLPRALVYQRITEERRGTESSASDGAAGSPVREADLVGRWQTQTPNGRVDLELGTDHRFRMAEYQGTWSLVSAGLRLEKSVSEVITYTLRLEGQSLELSGADLDTPVTFKRVGGEN